MTAYEISNKNIAKLKKIIEEDSDKPNLLSEAGHKSGELAQVSGEIRLIMDKKLPERDRRQEELIKKQELFKKVRTEYDKVSGNRQTAERILENCRAGILAEGLEDGKKCPVCGSVHHPEPASMPEKHITEEAYKKLQDKEKELLENKNKANTEAEKAKSALDEYENSLKEDILACLNKPVVGMAAADESDEQLARSIEAADKDIKRKIKENNTLVKALEDKCRALEEARGALNKAQGEDTDRLTKESRELNEAKQQNAHELTENRTKLNGMSDLGYEDWKAAEKAKAVAEKEAEKITDAIDKTAGDKGKAEKLVAELEASINTLKGSLENQKNEAENRKAILEENIKKQGFASVEDMLGFVVNDDVIREDEEKISNYDNDTAANSKLLEQAEKDAEGKTMVDINELTLQCNQQKKHTDEIRQMLNAADQRIIINTDKRNNIDSQRAELSRAIRENTVSQRLYKLVSGQTGNGKITLEQYIQATGFDGIISAANRRLMPMSGGRYELYRTDTIGRQTETFLDLVALDNYTGRRRPVGDLSGGESFNASLGLALGLSDTISSNLGGIQMDALFIDEGFGTLDRECIESALDVLINLSKTNKLVGIISHREEVAEKITQKITVEKTQHGSKITVDKGI